ncbi:MAG: restriction endonuclease subunit S [bacterium]
MKKKWKVGHGASGGKSDINVYGKDGKTLLIIECKTWGEEFEKEKIKMEEHGGQLFSYLNQDKNTQFLVLYTSKFENDEFNYNNLIVQIKDRKEDIDKKPEQLKQENIKLYKWANNKQELFEVWKESFNKYFHFNGNFDTDANAYSLELKSLKKKNLKNLDDAKGLFNKFAEILRHNNISDNANAFNRVLSLFLCKIVDEEKNDEDVLHFQVKEDEEYEHIIDRLQALYQIGMKKLNEEIIYYSEEDIHKIIKLYPKQIPIEKVKDIFMELKYYTNNEFAFKEVHNKKLFIQNARVLVEVMKLIQNYKFRFTSKQQILGDFFELMLNHGVKQSEGQFFTPIPIVRYIILSLGFENIISKKIKEDDIEFLPKILDYACGAGHFLTESIEELQQILKTIDTSELSLELKRKVKKYRAGTEWAENFIFGIEKDYRLARTSQIACYINGDGEANILFGDGLEEHDRLKLENKKFDVVIANPPYSVEAFRNYLNVGRTHFDLFESLTERSKEIEVLFIERTKQVLADGGLAGIILPSSILSNTGLYSKAREILLKYFEIKAITELGSKTFIATGTTTVILFLKRRDDDFLKDRKYIVDDLFNNIKYEINFRYIDDKKFLKMFVEHRGFVLDDYKQFLKLEINDRLSKTEMFKEYRNAFDNSTEIKQLQTKNYFKNFLKEEKEKEINKRFYEYCKDIEKEKFLYFMLCLGDGNKNIETIEDYYKFQKTVIVKTGKEIDEQKEYLGYEFIGRKGYEGIKINLVGGKMFDDTNYQNPEKANSYIRKAIQNVEIENISPEQEKYVSVFNIVDLIDFERISFEKIINTNSSKKIKIESKWNLVKLGDIADIQSGGTPDTNDKKNWDGNIYWATLVDTKEKYLYSTQRKITEQGLKSSSAKLLPVNTVIFSSRATIGEVTISKVETATNQGYKNFICDPKKIHFEYLYYILKKCTKNIQSLSSGATYDEISKTEISNFKIPLPPIDIQETIVKEIESIEKRETDCNSRINELKRDIVSISDSLYSKYLKKKLGSFCLEPQYGAAEKAIKGNPDTDYRYIRITDIDDDGNLLNEFMTAENIEEKFILEIGDFLFARSGNTVGKTFFFTGQVEKAIYAGYLIRFRPDRTVCLPKYLDIVTKSDIYKEWIKLNMAGVAQPNINAQQYSNYEIPLPQIAEQKKLVAIIEKNEKEIEKMKNILININSEKEEVLRKYL